MKNVTNIGLRGALNICLLFIITFLLTGLNTAGEDEWKLKKEKSGITIYTRVDEVTGNVEFKATVILKTTIDVLLDTFKNAEGYTNWMADVIVSETLRKVSNTEKYLYFEMRAPWPLRNRDVPVLQTIKKGKNSVEILCVGKPRYIPEKKGVVRIKMTKGVWKLTPLPDSRVEVVYRYLADPGASIPSRILNLFIVDAPFKTLTNLRSIVEH